MQPVGLRGWHFTERTVFLKPRWDVEHASHQAVLMTNVFRTEPAIRRSTCAVSIRFVWLFLEFAPRRAKLRLTEQLQARFGLSSTQFRDPNTRVALQLALDLLEERCALTSARDVGVLAARRAKLLHLGDVEYLARSKNTLGEAIDCIARYARLLSDGLHFQIEKRSDVAIVRLWFDSNLVLPNGLYEFVVATLLLSARRMSGVRDLTPAELHFPGPPPRTANRDGHLFKCKLCFNKPVTAIVLDARLLELALPKAEPALNRLLEKHADAILDSLPRSEDLVTMVRDMLAAETELRDTSAKRLARRLGVSIRTLARRLDQSGTSYRELLNEARRQIALRDLAQTLHPIEHIAVQLGFASSQSFHRAFRRWTGDTAASYRDRSRRGNLLQ